MITELGSGGAVTSVSIMSIKQQSIMCHSFRTTKKRKDNLFGINN